MRLAGTLNADAASISLTPCYLPATKRSTPKKPNAGCCVLCLGRCEPGCLLPVAVARCSAVPAVATQLAPEFVVRLGGWAYVHGQKLFYVTCDMVPTDYRGTSHSPFALLVGHGLAPRMGDGR